MSQFPLLTFVFDIIVAAMNVVAVEVTFSFPTLRSPMQRLTKGASKKSIIDTVGQQW